MAEPAPVRASQAGSLRRLTFHPCGDEDAISEVALGRCLDGVGGDDGASLRVGDDSFDHLQSTPATSGGSRPSVKLSTIKCWRPSQQVSAERGDQDQESDGRHHRENGSPGHHLDGPHCAHGCDA